MKNMIDGEILLFLQKNNVVSSFHSLGQVHDNCAFLHEYYKISKFDWGLLGCGMSQMN